MYFYGCVKKLIFNRRLWFALLFFLTFLLFALSTVSPVFPNLAKVRLKRR